MTSTTKSTTYRNPPAHSRFKPGHSGNPLGRPKKRKTVADELSEELAQVIRVREGTRTVELTKARAIAKELLRHAMDGDLRAATIVVSCAGRSSYSDDAIEDTTTDDAALIDNFVEREIRRRAANSTTEIQTKSLSPEKRNEK
jgi:Family of unknown function (DUF5681)